MITLWQPWASFIPLRVKRIETRPYGTDYRGPIIIHAAKSVTHLGLRAPSRREVQSLCAWPGWDVERDMVNGLMLRGPIAHPYRLPLGAVVATAELVDVLPILGPDDPTGRRPHMTIARHRADRLVAAWPTTEPHYTGGVIGEHAAWDTEQFDNEAPYGDFTPGRYGWILDAVRPVEPPIPARGFQGLRRAPVDVVDALRARMAQHEDADPREDQGQHD
jgi:activating signal cointegrator 1